MNTVFYLHIPKTGGQTLALRLASGFPADQVDVLGPHLRFPEHLGHFRALASNNAFIERHSTGSLQRALTDIDVLTTIREPVSQVASHYLHIVRAPANEMHRAATSMSMQDFFSVFGDLLANFQTRYLFSAFCTPRDFKAIDWTEPRTWCDKFHAVLDNIRWIVPTESIDDFTALWRLELRRQAPYGLARRNVALKGDHYNDLLELIRDRSDLYFADCLLWQFARRRYADYKEQLLRTLAPMEDSDVANRCYWNGHSGIWLLRDWYLPESHSIHEQQWWAGPSACSEIAYVRSDSDRFLHFDVGIFCGITPRDIWATTGNGSRALPLVRQQCGTLWRYWVDLQNQPARGSIEIRVPHVLAPILVDPASRDTRRLSFAAHGWSMESVAPDRINRGANAISSP